MNTNPIHPSDPCDAQPLHYGPDYDPDRSVEVAAYLAGLDWGEVGDALAADVEEAARDRRRVAFCFWFEVAMGVTAGLAAAACAWSKAPIGSWTPELVIVLAAALFPALLYRPYRRAVAAGRAARKGVRS